VTDSDTDPYTAYYEFEPAPAAFDDRRAAREHAEVRHELGLAGSPCRERDWGTKVVVVCPGCRTTGKVVSWDGEENVYSCADCGAVFDVPSDASADRPTRTRGTSAD
jgi:hypothetical protein